MRQHEINCRKLLSFDELKLCYCDATHATRSVPAAMPSAALSGVTGHVSPIKECWRRVSRRCSAGVEHRHSRVTLLIDSRCSQELTYTAIWAGLYLIATLAAGLNATDDLNMLALAVSMSQNKNRPSKTLHSNELTASGLQPFIRNLPQQYLPAPLNVGDYSPGTP